METFGWIVVISRVSDHSVFGGGFLPVDISSEGRTMKIRMLALAGVAAVALSAPAHAAEGWYIGLGGGYDDSSNLRTESVTHPTVAPRVPLQPSGIFALSVGYGWASGLRLEDEISYASHGVG